MKKAFKTLAAEAEKKDKMIRVKLGPKKKNIGHVITSPGKGGKPGKVLKRKGMPGKKDIASSFDPAPQAIDEKWSSIKAIKVAFRRDWEKVKSGKVDIGDKSVEKFYDALFNHFADTGEMPYGTQKARTGDPYEWIHDRLMDESFSITEKVSFNEMSEAHKSLSPLVVAEAVVDGNLVNELVLYITNDSQIYRQRIQPIIKNLSRKVGKATYDGIKAIKLFGYAVSDGLKKYEKEHATEGWARAVNKQTKEAIAEELLDYYSQEIGEDTRKPGYKIPQSKDPYTVKYSESKRGPIKITVVDGKKAAEKFLKDIKKQGMNGIIKKGWTQPGSTQTFKYGQSHKELSKAARYDTLTGKKRWGEEIEEGKKDGMWIVKYSDPKKGNKPAGTTTPATHKKAEAFLKKLIARGYTGKLVKEDVLEIDEGGMGGGGAKGSGGVKKRPMSDAQKERRRRHQQFLKISGMKKPKAPKKAAAKKRAKSVWSGTRFSDEYTPDHGGTWYEDIEKEIEGMISEVAPRASQKMQAKSAAREYKKLMAKHTRTRVFDITFSEFREIETAANKVMGVRPGGLLTPGSLVRDLEKFATNETYAPGNITRKRNPDFDERQGMFNSNYKRIHKKNPTKAEMRAAGVGKGGDNPKGVKAWKAAMAKLKALEGRK